MDRRKFKSTLLQAIKIAVGSSMGIYIAELLNLQYATSVGGIVLLTVITTKRETLKLSLARVLTFVIAALLGGFIYTYLNDDWIGYGIFLFLIVMICGLLGWKATISVNALIGLHFLTEGDFNMQLVFNEFCLLLIGIVLAILLNLIYDYRSQQKEIVKNMCYTEQQLQMILEGVAAYLSNKNMQKNLWDDIHDLEAKLKLFVAYAYEYQENTLKPHARYYADYFEMRSMQIYIIHSLHSELRKIRTMPEQAKVVAEYLFYLTDYVTEVNVPTEQIDKLNQIFKDMEKAPLPQSWGEFETRALLFHILMDIEEFLKTKKRFVEALDEKQLKMYWNKI